VLAVPCFSTIDFFFNEWCRRRDGPKEDGMEDEHKQADASLASAINIDSSDTLSVASAISLVDKVSPSQQLACSILFARFADELAATGMQHCRAYAYAGCTLYRRLLLQRELESPAARAEVQKMQARMSTVTLPALNEVRITPHWHPVASNGFF
jgi:hypothetical protein